jgi:hypothetical protein
MQCPKCGLTQMLSSACKSCGAPPAAPSLFARAVPSPPVHDPAADVARARRMEPPEPSPSKGEPGDQERLHLPTFHGRGATLFGIQIVNLFLPFSRLEFTTFGAKFAFGIISSARRNSKRNGLLIMEPEASWSSDFSKPLPWSGPLSRCSTRPRRFPGGSAFGS